MNLWVSESVLKAIEHGLLGLVLGLGLVCLVVFVLRQKALTLVMHQTGLWRQWLSHDLEQAVVELTDNSDGLKRGTGAAERLVRLGVNQAELCPEALERLLLAQERRERRLIEKGVTFLGTVGANAPFLGLTGTVLGILSAFRRMAEQGGSGGSDVMAAIAGALIATAAGLIVAIPAVVLYNVLKTKVRRVMEDLAEIRELLVARSLQATAREMV